jgi:hypothetical protein
MRALDRTASGIGRLSISCAVGRPGGGRGRRQCHGRGCFGLWWRRVGGGSSEQGRVGVSSRSGGDHRGRPRAMSDLNARLLRRLAAAVCVVC